jgi:hypothetical protein
VAHALVMQGSLDGDRSLDELLAVVGISRQWMEVVLMDGDAPAGRILCKAGRLVAVYAEPDRQGLDALARLRRGYAREFAVYQRPPPEGVGEPLGRIEHLVAEPAPPPDPTGDRTPIRELVLAGSFADTPLRDVLTTLALSRQHVVVLLRARGRTRGSIAIKSGRIVDAEHAGRRGADALRALIDDPGDGFVVYRVPPGTPVPEPLGRVEELLAPPPAPEEPPTIDLGPYAYDEAPTRVFALPQEPAPPTTARLSPVPPTLEDRVAELTAAVAALRDAVTAVSPARATRADDPVLLTMAVSQLLTLLFVGAVVLRMLSGG